MSNSFHFSHRRFGRAPSPPTWACYEQILHDDDDSDTGSEDDSCSEDDEIYDRDGHDESTSNDARLVDHAQIPAAATDADSMDMDIPHEKGYHKSDEKADFDDYKKDSKGKQRAVEPQIDDGPRRRQKRKKQREPMHALRPILTIHKSQGFVWNQDLFVPPYIKDRYIASTSPPNSHGFISTSASTVGSMHDYEVDVVEIRVKEGELAEIIP